MHGLINQWKWKREHNNYFKILSHVEFVSNLMNFCWNFSCMSNVNLIQKIAVEQFFSRLEQFYYNWGQAFFRWIFWRYNLITNFVRFNLKDQPYFRFMRLLDNNGALSYTLFDKDYVLNLLIFGWFLSLLLKIGVQEILEFWKIKHSGENVVWTSCLVAGFPNWS